MNTDCYSSTFSGRPLVKGWSDFHFYEFLHNDDHGLCLFLDGTLQSAEYDQHDYHEKLVRAALEEQRRPERVLIIGGAGGGCQPLLPVEICRLRRHGHSLWRIPRQARPLAADRLEILKVQRSPH